MKTGRRPPGAGLGWQMIRVRIEIVEDGEIVAVLWTAEKEET